MKRQALAVMLIVASCSQASANFYTYAQWDAMPEVPRAAYIAGVFDAMISYSSSEEENAINAQYQNCMRRAGMNNKQLSENVRAFARARPKMQQSVPETLVNYLIELCGAPP